MALPRFSRTQSQQSQPAIAASSSFGLSRKPSSKKPAPASSATSLSRGSSSISTSARPKPTSLSHTETQKPEAAANTESTPAAPPLSPHKPAASQPNKELPPTRIRKPSTATASTAIPKVRQAQQQQQQQQQQVNKPASTAPSDENLRVQSQKATVSRSKSLGRNVATERKQKQSSDLDVLGLPRASSSRARTPSGNGSNDASAADSKGSSATPQVARTVAKKPKSAAAFGPEDLLDTSCPSHMASFDSPSLTELARELEGIETPIKGRKTASRTPSAASQRSSRKPSANQLAATSAATPATGSAKRQSSVSSLAAEKKQFAAQTELLEAMKVQLEVAQQERQVLVDTHAAQVSTLTEDLLAARATAVLKDKQAQTAREADGMEDVLLNIGQAKLQRQQDRQALYVVAQDLALWRAQLQKMAA